VFTIQQHNGVTELFLPLNYGKMHTNLYFQKIIKLVVFIDRVSWNI